MNAELTVSKVLLHNDESKKCFQMKPFSFLRLFPNTTRLTEGTFKQFPCLHVGGIQCVRDHASPVHLQVQDLREPTCEKEISLSWLHSLISIKSCLFSTMALPRLLPSSIILWHIKQQSTHSLLFTQQHSKNTTHSSLHEQRYSEMMQRRFKSSSHNWEYSVHVEYIKLKV